MLYILFLNPEKNKNNHNLMKVAYITVVYQHKPSHDFKKKIEQENLPKHFVILPLHFLLLDYFFVFAPARIKSDRHLDFCPQHHSRKEF